MDQQARRYLIGAVVVTAIMLAAIGGYVAGLQTDRVEQEPDVPDEFHVNSFEADTRQAIHLVEILRELRAGRDQRAIEILERDLQQTSINAFMMASSMDASPHLLTRPWFLGQWSRVKAYRREYPAPFASDFDDAMAAEFWPGIPDIPPELDGEEGEDNE